MPFLEIENISFAYNKSLVIKNLSLAVKKGEMVGILGPNGSGKTTLIKLLSGLLRPRDGRIIFDQTVLTALSRRFIARNIAVVPQEFDIPFSFRVAEVVLMGRTPFHGLFEGENGKDRDIVAAAMNLTGLTGIADKRWQELSGGEKQKVVLATALAQSPKLLLLDEPTVHLDIANQVEMLELVKKRNRQSGLTIIAAIHDLNLAAGYFDRLVLLKEGNILTDGLPAAVLTEDNIRQAFAAGVTVGADPVSGAPHVFLRSSIETGQEPFRPL
jgi:iron complex transport system ATP-binding protein